MYSFSPLLVPQQQHEMATPSSPLTLYLCYSVPLFSLTMQSPHCCIPSCGWSLHIGCSAAEGVAKGCISQVLLLTSPGWVERKIALLEHVNSFAISGFSLRIKLESR